MPLSSFHSLMSVMFFCQYVSSLLVVRQCDKVSWAEYVPQPLAGSRWSGCQHVSVFGRSSPRCEQLVSLRFCENTNYNFYTSSNFCKTKIMIVIYSYKWRDYMGLCLGVRWRHYGTVHEYNVTSNDNQFLEHGQLPVKLQFLQGVSIACYAEPHISYGWVVRLPVRLSVSPSVCHTLSHAGTVWKWRKLRSANLHRLTLVLAIKSSSRNSKGSPRAGMLNENGVGKISSFRPINRYVSETVQNRTEVTINEVSIGAKITILHWTAITHFIAQNMRLSELTTKI